MKHQRRPQQKLNNAVLKNKIVNDLYLVGKSSILEIFDRYYESFELLIVSSSFNSEKIQEIVDTFKKAKIPVYFDTKQIHHIETNFGIDTGGVFVILEKRIGKTYSLRDIRDLVEKMETCTVVAFPDIDYEQNLGAMIRTSLAMNVDFILVSNRQQKVFSPVVTKVSMGYNFVIPVVQENFLLAIDELKGMRFEILGLDMGGENITNMYYNPKTCFIFGNEGSGLTSTVTQKCDRIVSIPMNTQVESMNVSTSLGIILFDRVSKLYKTD